MVGKAVRVGVGGISLESNDFVPFTADLTEFTRAGFLLKGDQIFALAHSDIEIGGALEELDRQREVEVVPLLAARGVSSGRVSADTYGELRQGLLDAVNSSSHLDGVYLFVHGSMEAVGEDDPEGDISAEVRRRIGPSAPLVISCDLHGNITQRMVTSTTAIIGYEHYPHDDTRQTGARAAALLLRTLRGDIAPTMAHAKLPLILTAFNSTTLSETPFRQVMDTAKALEQRGDALSSSVFLVGSYIDSPDMGCSTVVVTDANEEAARQQAMRLAQQFWERRFEFEVEIVSVAEAIQRGRHIKGGPILLLDTADTTGGGAAGDGIGLVRDLLKIGLADNETALAMVVDPAAADACHRAGLGAELELMVGHSRDPRWGDPLVMHGTVERLSDGSFRYRGGILGGVKVTMGPSAVVALGPIRLLIMSVATYDWGDDQYQALGLDPRAAKFVGVKNMMNFRFGYKDFMKSFFVLDLPGPTPPDMRQLPFRKIHRPTFPLDRDLADPEIAVTLSSNFARNG